jgi:biotin---protein ligase
MKLTTCRFSSVNLDKKADGPSFVDVVDTLATDEEHRMDFLKSCLTKLGLAVNQENTAVPSLSRIHLSSLRPSETPELLSSLSDIIKADDDGEEYIKDENDIFHLERPSTWKMSKLDQALPSSDEESDKKQTDRRDGDAAEDRIVDYNKVVKRLVAHEDDIPSSKETPYFNHYAFYSNIKQYQSESEEEDAEFGRHLLYGEVVTSTNTLLEKYGHPPRLHTHPAAFLLFSQTFILA